MRIMRIIIATNKNKENGKKKHLLIILIRSNYSNSFLKKKINYQLSIN